MLNFTLSTLVGLLNKFLQSSNLNGKKKKSLKEQREVQSLSLKRKRQNLLAINTTENIAVWMQKKQKKDGADSLMKQRFIGLMLLLKEKLKQRRRMLSSEATMPIMLVLTSLKKELPANDRS